MKNIFKNIVNDVFDTLEEELKTSNQKKERNEKSQEVIRMLKQQVNATKANEGNKVKDNLNSSKTISKKTSNFNEKYGVSKKDYKSYIEKKLAEGHGENRLVANSYNREESLSQRLESYKASKRSNETNLRQNIKVESINEKDKKNSLKFEELKSRDGARKAFINSIIFEKKV